MIVQLVLDFVFFVYFRDFYVVVNQVYVFVFYDLFLFFDQVVLFGQFVFIDVYCVNCIYFIVIVVVEVFMLFKENSNIFGGGQLNYIGEGVNGNFVGNEIVQGFLFIKEEVMFLFEEVCVIVFNNVFEEV